MTHCDTTEVAVAVSESSSVLPLHPCPPAAACSPDPGPRGGHAVWWGAQAVWAALVVQLLQPEEMGQLRAISGRALECGPSKVTLWWVDANYRPTGSPFGVSQPPGKQEPSEPAEGVQSDAQGSWWQSPRAHPASPPGRAARLGVQGLGHGSWSHRQESGRAWAGRTAPSLQGHLTTSSVSSVQAGVTGWPLLKGSLPFL